MTSLPRHPRSVARRLAGAALLMVLSASGAVLVPAAAHAAPSGTVAALPVRFDAIRDDQWQLRSLDAAAAWQHSTGAGVTVAVIDSGVDATHVDLAGQVLPGMDYVDDGDGRSDPVGHGTTVAGLIAGRGDDDTGVLGLAPDARILPVRVLDEENRYDDAMVVARAVRWAVDNGARVINLSLGGGGDSPALAAALDYAFAKDVVVVACTGNVSSTNSSRVWYPAREPGVIAVAGLERTDERAGDSLWSGSISGPETVLTAPATGLVGARPDGYWRVQGTSFAAPLVAATAALVRSRWPDMSAGTVVTRLIETARDLGEPGRDDRYGYGMVDPVAALTSGVAPAARNPLDDNATPGVVGFGPAPGLESPAPTLSGSAARLTGPNGDDQGAGWAIGPVDDDAERSGPGLFSGGALIVVVVGTGLWLAHRMYRVTGPAAGTGPAPPLTPTRPTPPLRPTGSGSLLRRTPR
ncbi:type VII secretion-associated serine protease mycosin [Solwaraspora sp. WMMD406]|uniref:type VII secretion-associated serine protease mycosin n=1 Tax=Solwaraspora sp. WMMD406 TaxID=3016095 RepID=UPI00241801F8|nr:type VII secretion-associated serine protease mycosin [Solwaraspora sp. WMMD406]MDG4768478.1 type VII secretion-associated serine protease mycosin [Solwaraspora sp. WMMD406]